MPPRKKKSKGPAALAASKQDFLKRCSADAVESGATEAQAMAQCTASWNQQQLEAFVDEGVLSLSAPVELAQAEDESAKRRFSILAYTGKLIDWGYWGRFIIDLSGIQMSKPKIPALRDHCRSKIVGTIDAGSSDDNGFYVSGAFSQVTVDAAEVIGLADEGFPWQASIGVQATKIVQLAKDAVMEVNGQTVTGPCDVWTESRVFEVSVLPFGADDDTATIAMAAELPGPDGQGDVVMNKKLRKLLEKLGLDPAATEQEAVAYMAGLDPDVLAKELAAPPTTQGAQPQGAQPQADQADVVGLSGQDVLILLERGKRLGVDEAKLQELAKTSPGLPEATLAMVDLVALANPPVGGGRFEGRVEGGQVEMEKFTLAAEDALCLRGGMRLTKPSPGAQELRGRTLRELAREYLERQGVSTRMMTNNQMAGAALGVVRLSGMHTTSDFANILSNVASKVMQRAYEEAPSTWQIWCAVGEASDFKPSERPQLSEAPSLELINEHGEYTAGTFSDFKESNQVKTYGRKFMVTRKTIVNDDLNALLRIPKAFGAAGQRRINDIVYYILTANQTMAYDSKALFHADHANLANPADVLGTTGLSNGRKGMRVQTGPNDSVLNIVPRYLLVPASLETSSEVLLHSVSSVDDNKNEGVANPWRNALVPVVESRLDSNSTTAWYLAADPNQVDTIEVVFLDGVQAPVIEEAETADIDGKAYYVRLDVGARALDHRGLRKSAGTGS